MQFYINFFKLEFVSHCFFSFNRIILIELQMALKIYLLQFCLYPLLINNSIAFKLFIKIKLKFICTNLFQELLLFAYLMC